MTMTNVRKLLLLGLLSQSDMHGYHLNAHLESNIPIQIKKPTAYNLLARMEEDGWIVPKSEFTGNRERRVYSLTTKGKEIYQQLLKQELSTFTFQEYPNLVSLWLLGDIPDAERKQLLESRRQAIHEKLLMFSEQPQDRENLKSHHEGSSALVIEFIRRSLSLELEILDEIINTYGK